MGTITALTVIAKAGTVLSDTEYTRWTNDEMIGWLTDAQREAVIINPKLYTKTLVRTLAAGARQDLSDITDYHLLVEVVRNMAADGVTPGRTVSPADAAVLAAFDPYWQSGTRATEVVHSSFDLNMRDKYLVYPPAVAGSKVEIVYSAVPPAITSLSSVISLPDKTATALMDYLCYRAASKEAEFANSLTVAAGYYKLFSDAIPKL